MIENDMHLDFQEIANQSEYGWEVAYSLLLGNFKIQGIQKWPDMRFK